MPSMPTIDWLTCADVFGTATQVPHCWPDVFRTPGDAAQAGMGHSG
ncbi:hypothetical protein [Acidovorax sp. NCPPB 4044]|nr:hypothetical protein [Acidovorax sp. NCPPB 4044]MDA8523401.1 hypothetical protein [Acidovorax sp. NCPPB 4044]